MSQYKAFTWVCFFGFFFFFFNLSKGPAYWLFVLKFGDNVPSSKQDMAQNVILQGDDLERVRSSLKVNNISISTLSSTHTVQQLLTEKVPGKERQKGKIIGGTP